MIRAFALASMIAVATATSATGNDLNSPPWNLQTEHPNLIAGSAAIFALPHSSYDTGHAALYAPKSIDPALKLRHNYMLADWSDLMRGLKENPLPPRQKIFQ